MIQDTSGAEGLFAIIIHSLDIYMHTNNCIRELTLYYLNPWADHHDDHGH